MAMKRLIVLLLLLSSGAIQAQVMNPVTWSYSCRKTGPGAYELHFKAVIESPWHIYSQFTPAGGPIPTVISFNKNPLVTLEGKTKETGKLKQKNEAIFKLSVKYFEDKVEFLQLVKVKDGVKTSVEGTISYMICNDEMCLPPAKDKFTLNLN